MSTVNGPWPPDAKYLRIGDVCLDLRYRHVLRDGESIELQQRIFDLLLLFIAEPHKLHTRADLFDRLWPKLIVDDANLTQSVWLLRKALGESRKQWVRTVAKGGYVFESPGPVTWSNERPSAVPAVSTALVYEPEQAGEPPEAASQETAAAPDQGPQFSSAIEAASAAPPPHEPPAKNPGRRGWMRWATAAMLLAAVAVGLIVWRGGLSRPTPERPLAVALIPLQDSAETLRWPAKLLQDWLGWKLGSLPEVNLLSEADLAAATAQPSPVVVFLTSARVPGAEGQVVVRARLQGLGKELRLEETGPLAQVPAMVDRLSRRILERLDAPRAEPWPALDLSAAAAQRYVQAAEATDRRDWMAVSAIGADVVRQAPRFGLMRLRLAQAQSRLSQFTTAKEQMEAARGLLRPIPDDVKNLLDAQALAVDPDRAEQAAKAFGSIAARYPAKAEYTLEHARLLVKASQPKEALSLLRANLMQHSPVGLRIARHLVAASAAGGMGELDLQRLHARAAENLARVAGHGWELERAEALVVMGRVDKIQYPESRNTRPFVEAAKQFDQAGNTTGALYAQFLVETVVPPVSGPNPRLDTLLAKARAGGYRTLEISILKDIAHQHENVGDAADYRNWLEQAWAVAKDSGDTAARNGLDLSLAQLALLDLRLADAQVRLTRLKRADPEGSLGRSAYSVQSALDQMHGNLSSAFESQAKSTGKLPAWSPGQPVPAAVAYAACERVVLWLAAGDLANARKDFVLCNETTVLHDRRWCLILEASIEAVAGNRAQAERALAEAKKLPLVGGMATWSLNLDHAELLAALGRVNEAQQLAEEVQAELPAQYRYYRQLAASQLARYAIAKGDWVTARRHADEARRLLPSDDAWALSSEVDLIDALLALLSGDRARAVALASAVHKQAHQRRQVLVVLKVHSMFPPGLMTGDCSAVQRQVLVARTGMRGVSLDWLTRGLRQETPMPGSDIRGHSAANTAMSPSFELSGR